ncbi:MAG: hypothetical protein A2W06_06780 [Alphaproteobacteria bacterium RBG_16_42_14]|nr:MAG: hypothetical protein A2W06_06780 [Alphaproteobacteria bacterium RBG_16_42_14]
MQNTKECVPAQAGNTGIQFLYGLDSLFRGNDAEERGNDAGRMRDDTSGTKGMMQGRREGIRCQDLIS